MGRPKVYADAAAKQRAYRERLQVEMVRVNRDLWAALEGRVDRLIDAVNEARSAGCPIAKEIHGAATETVLDSLIEWFETQAAQARACARGTSLPEGAGSRGKVTRSRRA